MSGNTNEGLTNVQCTMYKVFHANLYIHCVDCVSRYIYTFLQECFFDDQAERKEVKTVCRICWNKMFSCIEISLSGKYKKIPFDCLTMRLWYIFVKHYSFFATQSDIINEVYVFYYNIFDARSFYLYSIKCNK